MPTEPRQKVVIARAERNDGPWVNTPCVCAGGYNDRVPKAPKGYFGISERRQRPPTTGSLFSAGQAPSTLPHTEFGGILVCILG